MIVLINQANGLKIRFKDYTRLYDYIENRQRVKRSREAKPLPPEWVFTCHSWRRMVAFHEFVAQQKAKDEKNQATGSKGKKYNALEISYNRSKNPVLVPITPGMDIWPYLEDWCRRYCRYHGFKLVEIQEDDGVLHVKKEPVHSGLETAPDGEGREPTGIA
jgi:hypothetical protein